MKLLFWVLILLSLPAVSQAQDEDGATAQRARIATERNNAAAAFRAQEKACYGKFAVNDCLNAARAQRREVLADLRRQEMSMNNAQRKRQAAEHLRAIEERSTPEKRQQDAQRRTTALEKQRERESAAAQTAAERSSKAQEAAGRAAKDGARGDASHRPNAADQARAESKQAEAAAARTRRAEEAAQNVKKREQKQIDAEDRKAGVDQRLAERNKPKAQPLPTP